jgi:hypothetical protein
METVPREGRGLVSPATGGADVKPAAVAARLFRALKQRFKDKIPKAVNCVEKDFDKMKPFFGFP